MGSAARPTPDLAIKAMAAMLFAVAAIRAFGAVARIQAIADRARTTGRAPGNSPARWERKPKLLIVYRRVSYRVVIIVGGMRWPTYEEASGAVFGGAGVFLAIWMMQAPATRLRPITNAFTLRPAIEPPATVRASIEKLQRSPLLNAIDTKRSSCSRAPKGAPTNRCFYSAGDMEITVSWYKKTKRLSALTIRRTEPQGSVQFGWPGLSETIALLCDGVTVDEANAILRDVPARVSNEIWTDLNGDRVAASAAGARRRLWVMPRAGCWLAFSEVANWQTREVGFYASLSKSETEQ